MTHARRVSDVPARARWAWLLAPVMVVAGCGDGPSSGSVDGADVERFPLDTPLAGAMVAVGDTLLVGAADDGGTRGSQRPGFSSTDLGESWEPLDLPGAPAELQYRRPSVDGELALVTGLVPSGPDEGARYLWASRDGVEWSGGRLPTERRSTGPFDLMVVVAERGAGGAEEGGAGGRRMAALAVGAVGGGPAGADLLYSDDDGATWAPAEAPDLDLEPDQEVVSGRVRILRFDDGPLLASIEIRQGNNRTLLSDDGGATWRAGSCPPEGVTTTVGCIPPRVAGSLWVTGEEVSLDGGQSWQEFTIAPAIDRLWDRPQLDRVVELPGGGWLASASTWAAGDVSAGFLVRSDDGLNWHQQLSDPCPDLRGVTRPNSTVFGPAPLGDRWVASYSCGNLGDAVRSAVYLLSADGTDPVELPGVRTRRTSHRGPITIGDLVVVPEERDVGGDRRTTALVRVRPN